VNIGETALARWVEMFTLAQAGGDRCFDLCLNSAEAVVGVEVGGQRVDSVGKTETYRRGFGCGFVGYLRDDFGVLNSVVAQIEDDGAGFRGTELPVAHRGALAMRLHHGLAHQRTGDTTARARCGLGCI